MTDLIDFDETQLRRRPAALSVLCCLTWIGSLLQLSWSVWMIYDVYVTDIRRQGGLDNPEGFMAVMGLFGLGAILTAWGSIRLFRLRKGIILYFIGELMAPVILITMAILSPPEKSYSTFVYGLIASVLAISGLFIFMYVRVVLKNKTLFNGRVAG